MINRILHFKITQTHFINFILNDHSHMILSIYNYIYLRMLSAEILYSSMKVNLNYIKGTPTASSGYIILLNNAGHSTGREESGTWDIEELTEDIPTLHTSFRASTQTFSVMFKVKVHKAPDNAHYSLLRIVG